MRPANSEARVTVASSIMQKYADESKEKKGAGMPDAL
jgi:hypothetical protein